MELLAGEPPLSARRSRVANPDHGPAAAARADRRVGDYRRLPRRWGVARPRSRRAFGNRPRGRRRGRGRGSDAVLLHDSYVGARARVTRAIVDEEANVDEDTVVGGIDEIAVVAGRLEDS